MISRPVFASRRCLLACTWCLCITTLACRQADDPAYSRGSTVVVAYPYETLNDETAEYLVFLTLVAHDKNGELEGRLARSWEYSPDNREVTYHLRTNIRWHDGVPVTAHDIKFSMELLMHPDVLEEAPGFFGSVTVVDDSTLTLRDGNAGTDEVYYPKHLLEDLEPKEFYDWDFWDHPVGNGPYRFVRYVPQTMMEFQANHDYYQGKPKIERVVLKFVGEAGLTELLSGNVDAITETNSAQIPKLANDPRFRAYHSLAVWWIQRALYWRNDHALFRDPNVRRALTLAINREELLRVINLSQDIPIIDAPYTFPQLRRGQLPEPFPYDPARARALLDAAGWQERNADGVREREGREFRFTALVGSLHENREIAVYIQDQLRRVGVAMDIQTLPNLDVFARIESGKFEAALSTFPVPGFLWRLHFGERYPLGYENAELVTLVDQMDGSLDPETEDRIYRELAEIFRADMPVTFLFPYVRTTLAHRRLRGLSSPWRADPVVFMEELWLEDE